MRGIPHHKTHLSLLSSYLLDTTLDYRADPKPPNVPLTRGPRFLRPVGVERMVGQPDACKFRRSTKIAGAQLSAPYGQILALSQHAHEVAPEQSAHVDRRKSPRSVVRGCSLFVLELILAKDGLVLRAQRTCLRVDDSNQPKRAIVFESNGEQVLEVLIGGGYRESN